MNGSRILVVDDDPQTLDTVRDCLREAGYEVATARSGRDALGRLLDEQQPALIILDMHMPVMDGREFLTITRAYHRLAQIPVLVLSAIELPVHLAESVEVVMRKPFRVDELVANAEVLVGRGVGGAH
jgi:CheY-like chemotaxis protein